MQIDAPTLNTLMTATETPSTSVAPADVEAFSQALFGRPLQTPEQSALSGLQGQSQAIEARLTGAKEATLENPAQMLTVQSQLLRSIFEVDLLAKTAGGLTQGINKLVSMQ